MLPVSVYEEILSSCIIDPNVSRKKPTILPGKKRNKTFKTVNSFLVKEGPYQEINISLV